VLCILGGPANFLSAQISGVAHSSSANLSESDSFATLTNFHSPLLADQRLADLADIDRS
jgi:hypothetical protein